MPEQTIRAFADHGDARPDAIEKDVEQARSVAHALGEMGIGLDLVAWQLEHEGIQKFIDAYDTALHTLDDKLREPVEDGRQR